jgi:TPR repeat protein
MMSENNFYSEAESSQRIYRVSKPQAIDEHFLKEIEVFQNEVRKELIARYESLRQYLKYRHDDNIEMNPNFNLLREILHAYPNAIEGKADSIYKLGLFYFDSNGFFKDEHFAIRLLKYASSGGDAQSFLSLSQLLYFEFGTQQDIEQVADWFERGLFYSVNHYTFAFLGSYYLNRNPPDRQKGMECLFTAINMGHPDKFSLYIKLAEEGNAIAQYMIGSLYLEGQDIPQDIKEGLKWLQKSADQNNDHAQCYLGAIYLQGLFGIDANPQTAIHWLQLASEQSNDNATKYLADCFLLGQGTEKNIDKAILLWKKFPQDQYCQYSLAQLYLDETLPEYYNPKEAIKRLRQAAQQDHLEAQVGLGIYLLKGGDGADQNIKEARTFLHKAAKQNHPVAQFYLAEIYAEGNGVPANRKEAFKWYLASAESGYIPALQIVSKWFLKGIGTAKNELKGYNFLTILAVQGDEEALTLLNNAATAGNAIAQYTLSRYFADKNESELATYWLEKSVAQGFAVAQCQLAFVYSYNNDHERYIHYLKLAAEQGEPEAQTLLASAYESGFYVTQNLETAFQLAKKAAEQGHVKANLLLGSYYDCSHKEEMGIERDPVKAAECLQKAAKGGNPEAIDQLGYCYLYGIGVETIYDYAFQLFQQAAMLGNPMALFHIGFCYLAEFGRKRNQELALKWISLAAKSGHPEVLKQIQNLGIDIESLNAPVL